MLALVLASCGREAPPSAVAAASAPTAPGESLSGVILRVDGLELTAVEVEPLVADIGELYPEYAPIHLRRLALTNEFLPRLAARATAREAWAAARDACLRAGQEGVPLEQLADWHGDGTYHGLGLGLWSAARRLPVGEWSAPIELPGRWVRARVDVRAPAADPREERLSLSTLTFPYLPLPAESSAEGNPLEAAIDHATLTLLDPEWAEAVPETWKHRMRGSKP
ncbi:MAG: peptidyl-prolyl cis-trans isomerase [Planctomycetes bacterium]|nr:peptidyl-prolyl cis-trans isomerase [Planctomycetota bacterium]